jgi:hypothetical protein
VRPRRFFAATRVALDDRFVPTRNPSLRLTCWARVEASAEPAL